MMFSMRCMTFSMRCMRFSMRYMSFKMTCMFSSFRRRMVLISSVSQFYNIPCGMSALCHQSVEFFISILNIKTISGLSPPCVSRCYTSINFQVYCITKIYSCLPMVTWLTSFLNNGSGCHAAVTTTSDSQCISNQFSSALHKILLSCYDHMVHFLSKQWEWLPYNCNYNSWLQAQLCFHCCPVVITWLTLFLNNGSGCAATVTTTVDSQAQ